jgi:hypothetical protein
MLWSAAVAPRTLIITISAALLACTEASLRLAAFARGSLTFDVGPSTGAYLTGFLDSEERPPTTLRWARNHARVDLPLAARGGAATLRLRFGRFVDQTADVQVFVNGQPAGHLRATPGRQRVESLDLTLPADEPLSLAFVGDDPQDLALALDWLRLEGAALRPAPAVLAPRLLPLGVLLVALLAGCTWYEAGLAAVLTLAGVLAWAAGDPFGLVHVSQRVTLPALACASLAACWLRRRPQGRWVALAFLLSYLLKGVTLFHPSYFYNDVRNNRRYVEALRDDPGSLAERSHAAQVRIGVAYPRIVAGQKYAFPYSPVFFLPFGLLPHDHTVVDEGLKHASVACSALEVLLVFLLAVRVFGPRAAVVAAGLAVFLPIQYSRLVLAMWSTVGGHVFDALALWAAMGWALQPASRRAFALTAATVQASLLTYVASLFNMTLFAFFGALLVRPLRWRLLGLGFVAAVLTVGLLYFDFTLLFVREILPAFLAAGAAGSQPAPDRLTAMAEALARIPLFYGWLWPIVALFGLLVAHRRAPRPVFRMLAAYGLVFVALVLLRGLGGGLFKDLKEIEFVAPLAALLAGGALAEGARRPGVGRWASMALTAAIVAFGASTSWAWFRTWTVLADLP